MARFTHTHTVLTRNHLTHLTTNIYNVANYNLLIVKAGFQWEKNARGLYIKNLVYICTGSITVVSYLFQPHSEHKQLRR